MQISPDERPERSTSTGSGNKWILLVIMLCILGGLGYFLLMPTSTPPKSTKMQPETLTLEESAPVVNPPSAATSVITEDIPQQPVPAEPSLILPTLDESDESARKKLNSLTPDGKLSQWFHADHIIRRSITLIDGLSRGILLPKMLNVPTPKSKFLARKEGEHLWIDPNNYQRYNYLKNVIESVDSNQLIDFFHLFRPLLEQAYEELGYPPEDLDNAIIAALDQVLATPIPKTPVALTQESVQYKYADKQLEALPPIQKQLLRMGPDNTRSLQRKARELRNALLGAGDPGE